jgi:cytosine/adenosine deaminase-related metal-dependent hydrolase
MLIQHIRLADREGLWQIRCQDGVITAIEPHDEHAVAGRVLDGEGGLVIAPFIEPHIHLDTTQTAGEPSWNLSGTLFEGIERWAERKALLTHEDVKQRAIQTLKWQIANGIQFVRTHVDVSDPNLVALKALREVREVQRKGQRCALPRPPAPMATRPSFPSPLPLSSAARRITPPPPPFRWTSLRTRPATRASLPRRAPLSAAR